MTPEEYNRNLTELYGLVSGDLAQDVIAVPAARLLERIKRRITVEGKNSNDQGIGDYSLTPIYASKNLFVKPGAFKPEGKKGIVGDRLVPTIRLKSTSVKNNPVNYKSYTAVKPNYQQRKTMYLPAGYRQLRSIQGLRTDVVNIKYRGDLIADYKMAKDSQAFLIGFTTSRESAKRKGLEKHFRNRIFYATPLEMADYTDDVNFNLIRITVGTLSGDPNATINQDFL